MGRTRIGGILAIASLLSACSPLGEAIATQQQNQQTRMGELLFNDTRLGADGTTSCSSCHAAEHAFTDARAVSIGAFGKAGTRNAPSLIGLRAKGPQFWDGRESSLAAAVLQPWANPVEMGHATVPEAMQHISRHPEYAEFLGRPVTEQDIAEALSSYLLSLQPAPSPYDRARLSGDSQLLGPRAERGMALFKGKAQCASCHSLDGTHELSDGKFHHASVGFERIAGNLRNLQIQLEDARAAGPPLGTLVLTETDIAELGRFAVSGNPKDMGAFRTPSLRNVARTAPYMHDGSIQTLDAAVEHELYYRGLTTGQPISLTIEERHDLIAFLQALSNP